MRNNLSPTSFVLDPNAPSSSFTALSAHWERKIAARWKEWVPWVWIYLRQRGYAPAGSPELARLRRRHSEDLLGMMRAGIGMRLVRRHRLDDPRITEELRAVLVHAVMERRRKARRGSTAIADSSWRLESSQTLPPETPRKVIASQREALTIDSVRKLISEHFHLRELRDQELTVRSNRQIITFPRQLAMYIARQLTTASLPEIGRQFGGKHHTTVLHSINKIEQMRHSDRNLDGTIAGLTETLRQQ